MRWFIFILAFLPNLVLADKALRDEYIKAVSSVIRRHHAFAPFVPNYSDPNHQNFIDKAKDNRLIMQFEIDETFYSKDKLAALAMSITKGGQAKLDGIANENTFSEDEKKYLEIKVMEILAELRIFSEQLLESPKFHADVIRQCAKSYDVTD